MTLWQSYIKQILSCTSVFSAWKESPSNVWEIYLGDLLCFFRLYFSYEYDSIHSYVTTDPHDCFSRLSITMHTMLIHTRKNLELKLMRGLPVLKHVFFLHHGYVVLLCENLLFLACFICGIAGSQVLKWVE